MATSAIGFIDAPLDEQPIYPVAWIVLSLVPELLQETLGESIGDDPETATAAASGETRGGSQPLTIQGPPLKIAGERNNYVSADTCRITLDLEDWPFDPRLVRGASVVVYVADAGRLVDPGDYWRSLTQGELRARAAFAGVVDQVVASFDDQARTIELKCRDYTAYFLDTELVSYSISWVKNKKNLKLTEILRDLMDQIPQTRPLRIEIRGSAESIAAIEALEPQTYKGPRSKEEKTGKRNTRHGEAVWDVVQELALEGGIVAYIDLDRLVLAEPQTLNPERVDAEELFVFNVGGKVEKYESSRELGRQHGINVRVTSLNPDTHEVLTALSPTIPELQKRTALIPGKEMAKEPTKEEKIRALVRPFVVRGITDQKQLQKIADAIYTQLRHHEVEGTLTTREMGDEQGRRFQEMRYGAAITLGYTGPIASVLAKSGAEFLRHLEERGYDGQTAREIVKAQEALQVPYYVDRMRYSYDSRSSDSAWELEIDIRTRKQVDLIEGSAQKVTR